MGIEFRKVTRMPEHLNTGAVERAVRQFVMDSKTEEKSVEGLYDQTLELIATSILFGRDGMEFWMADHDGEVVAYALAHVSKDVDNSLCYWITQGFVTPKARRHPAVKMWFSQLRDEAKRLGCKHIIVPSSRGVKAYCRWLGKNWNLYVSLLKEDI